MDLQDLQDDCRSDLQYGEITEKIMGVHSKSSMSWEPGFLNQFMRKPWQSLFRTRDSEFSKTYA